MKLALDKKTCVGQIVTDFDADKMTETHRIVNAKFSHSDDFGGAHYVDVWGGTWRLAEMTGETTCTTGALDRWS